MRLWELLFNEPISQVHLNEDGQVVQGVNTTCDVKPGEIARQAAKFGNKLKADGTPPLITD
jgi:hypothetical protein